MKELRSEAARLLASARARGPITCEICGTVFEGYTSGKRPGRYCSPPCQRKGYRLTHREAERERKRRSRERRRTSPPDPPAEAPDPVVSFLSRRAQDEPATPPVPVDGAMGAAKPT